MGDLNILAIVLAAAALFLVGIIWYGVLFRRLWQREARVRQIGHGRLSMPVVFALTFAFEMLIALTLAHQFAMSNPSPRGIMMISIGFGALIMAPAVGIVYLHLRKSGKLFAIDAGHMVLGMAAMGAVFVLFR